MLEEIKVKLLDLFETCKRNKIVFAYDNENAFNTSSFMIENYFIDFVAANSAGITCYFYIKDEYKKIYEIEYDDNLKQWKDNITQY